MVILSYGVRASSTNVAASLNFKFVDDHCMLGFSSKGNTRERPTPSFLIKLFHPMGRPKVSKCCFEYEKYPLKAVKATGLAFTEICPKKHSRLPRLKKGVAAQSQEEWYQTPGTTYSSSGPHSVATLDTDAINEQLVPSTPVTHFVLGKCDRKSKVLKCTLKVLENRSTFEMY